MKSVGVSMCSVCLCGTETENIEALVMNFTKEQILETT